MARIANPDTCVQALILKLQNYWARRGCAILQPYDMEVGAGTFHWATTLRSLGPKPRRFRLVAVPAAGEQAAPGIRGCPGPQAARE